VTLPYSPSDITGLDDSTLDVFYFAGPDYSASGVSGVTVDTGNRTVSFSTTHFTVFLIAGQGIDSDGDGVADIEDAFPNNRYGATDSDGDGIGDEWEDHWFGDDDDIIEPGDLDTADALSDSDFDGLSDLTEFLYAFAGLDPTDGTSQLPAAGAAACALLMAALAAAGAANTRRRRT